MNDNFIPLKDLKKKIISITDKIDISDICNYYTDGRPLITFGYIMYHYNGNLIDEVPFVRLVRYKYLWYQYHYGSTERGEIIDEHYSRDYEDVIYWYFKDISYNQSYDLIRMYREDIKANNFSQRRFLYKKQLDTLNQIDPKYGMQFRKDTEILIKTCPFNDGYPETLEYIDEYLAEHLVPMPCQPKARTIPEGYFQIFNGETFEVIVRYEKPSAVKIRSTSDDDNWYDMTSVKALLEGKKKPIVIKDTSDLILFFNVHFQEITKLFKPEDYPETRQQLETLDNQSARFNLWKKI
jgi:hypothetical protein